MIYVDVLYIQSIPTSCTKNTFQRKCFTFLCVYFISSQPIALYQKPRRFVPAGWQIPLSNEISWLDMHLKWRKNLNVQQNQQPMVNPRVFIIKTTSKFNTTNHQVQQAQVVSNEYSIIKPNTKVILRGKTNQGFLILRILEHQETATTLGIAAWIVASKGSMHTVLTAVGVVMEWWYLW